MKKAVIAALVAALYGATAHADGFGGLETAYTRDDNFTGAPAGSPKTAESMVTYSGYLGGYWPAADRRSAWVLKANAAVTRLDKFDVFDNQTLGLSTGVFHAFNGSHSMTATAGVQAKRFDDKARDYDVYSLQLGFKQKTSGSFFFREGLVYETASAKVRSNEYDGAGVNVSLNWTPSRSSLLTLGLGRIVRDYEVTVANKRTNTFATLGFVQQFGRYVYLRGGVTRQNNRTNAGAEYDGDVYTVGLGFSL